MSERLSPGDTAPDFTLTDDKGAQVSLSDLRGKKVIVYFYPAAMTPGCTTQACDFSDNINTLHRDGYEVLGISPDKPEKQAKFDQKYSLGFPLLADTEHAVAEAYGVWAEKKNYGKTYMGIVRSAFLIDEQGKIAAAWYKVSPADTPKNLLAALA